MLSEAGLRAEAAHIACIGADVSQTADPPQPFGASIPTTKATSGEVLLAWAMNDQARPTAHGAPLRVVLRGWIGARSVKWFQRLTAQAEATDNHFQTEYSILPPEGDPHKAAPSDGITSRPARHPPRHPAARQGRPAPVRPDRGDRLRPRGRRPNRGTRGRIPDGGSTWVHADLDEPENPWTWQHWHAALIMPPGGAQLIARAWDDTAAVPPESPATVWNPRGYANNSWARPHVIVRP